MIVKIYLVVNMISIFYNNIKNPSIGIYHKLCSYFGRNTDQKQLTKDILYKVKTNDIDILLL